MGTYHGEIEMVASEETLASLRDERQYAALGDHYTRMAEASRGKARAEARREADIQVAQYRAAYRNLRRMVVVRDAFERRAYYILTEDYLERPGGVFEHLWFGHGGYAGQSHLMNEFEMGTYVAANAANYGRVVFYDKLSDTEPRDFGGRRTW